MFCKSLNSTPNEDFSACIDILFNSVQTKSNNEDETNKDSSYDSSRPRILFSYYFSHIDSATRLENNLNKDLIPNNLHLISGSSAKLDFDYHCTQVKFLYIIYDFQ